MNLLTIENLRTVPEKAGVYKIFVYNTDEKPVGINRFAKLDKSGLVYIGRTSKKTLKTRLMNFLFASQPTGKTTSHSGALKYREREIIKNTLGKHHLVFEYEVTNDGKNREIDLLRSYAKEFGEHPLLNH